MVVPNKRRRRKLLLKAADLADDAAVKTLSEMWPIYEKDGTIQALTPEDEAVVNIVNTFYLEIDSGDNANFDICAASIATNVWADGIEAIENEMPAWRSS